MQGSRGDLSPLEKAWREALADYTQEVKKTLGLLTAPGLPDPRRLEAIEEQRAAEQEAFEKFRRARRAFLGSILGGGLVVLAVRTLEWV
jgi:ferric-dicitrate binding protein FerR (iron transport regulator)